MQFVTTINIILFFVALLVLAGIVSSLVSRKLGAPLLLVFLGVGMLAGEDGIGGIGFSNFPLTYLIGSLSLAIILFDGGLRLKLEDFKANLWPSLSLATFGVVVTTAVVGGVAMHVFHFSFLEALLLGAILASTDAAAVMSLLRSSGVKIPPRIVHTLEIESGTNDPIAIFLTLTLVGLISAGQSSMGWGVLGMLAQEGLIGGAAGIVGGAGISWLQHRLRLNESLNALFVLAGGILVFSGTALMHGSGFLAVYLAGIAIASKPIRARENVLRFHDSITLLAQIVMFLTLGLLVAPSHLIPYIAPGLIIAITLTFIARPLAVWLCLTPFPQYSANEKSFISWVGLRGAVAIFLAAIPKLSGLPNAGLYFNVAFFVVLTSLIVKGWSIPFIARYLDVEGKPRPTRKV